MNILSRLELHPRSPTYVMFLICLNPLPKKKGNNTQLPLVGTKNAKH